MTHPATQKAAEITKNPALRKGAHVVKAHKHSGEYQKRVNPNFVYKCVDCKNEIKVGDIYYAFGIKARTYHQRMHASRGHTWVKRCEGCVE